jgi:hypothetical protein
VSLFCPIPVQRVIQKRVRRGMSAYSPDGLLMHRCAATKRMLPADTGHFYRAKQAPIGLAGYCIEHQNIIRRKQWAQERRERAEANNAPKDSTAPYFPIVRKAHGGALIPVDVQALLAEGRYKLSEGSIEKQCSRITCSEWLPADTGFFLKNSKPCRDPLHSWCRFCMDESRRLAKEAAAA